MPEVSKTAELLVMFNPDATESDVQALAKSIGASLISTQEMVPGMLVCLLSVPADQLDACVERANLDPRVKVAEPNYKSKKM